MTNISELKKNRNKKLFLSFVQYSTVFEFRIALYFFLAYLYITQDNKENERKLVAFTLVGSETKINEIAFS